MDDASGEYLPAQFDVEDPSEKEDDLKLSSFEEFPGSYELPSLSPIAIEGLSTSQFFSNTGETEVSEGESDIIGSPIGGQLMFDMEMEEMSMSDYSQLQSISEGTSIKEELSADDSTTTVDRENTAQTDDTHEESPQKQACFLIEERASVGEEGFRAIDNKMQTDRGDVLLLMDRQEESAVFVEALQNTLIYRLDCVKNMIQSKGTTNQKIQDELIQINRVATCTDLVGEKDWLECDLNEEGEGENMNRGRLPQIKLQSQSMLGQKAKDLKEANHCLIEYGEVLKKCELENVLLRKAEYGLQEKAVELEEALCKAKEDNEQLMDLRNENIALNSKVKNLEDVCYKKIQLMDTVRNYENDLKEIQDTKEKALEEKEELEKSYKTLHSIHANTAKALQESQDENKSLKMKLAEKSEDYTFLLEQCESDQQAKKKLMNQCAKQQFSLRTKEEEILICSRYIVDLEQKVKSYNANMDKIKIKNDNLRTSVESFNKELKLKEASWKKEKDQLTSMYLRFLAEVETLRRDCEKEHAETENLQHQVQAAKLENAQLRQLTDSGKAEKETLRLEADRWKQQVGRIQEKQAEKFAKKEDVLKRKKEESKMLLQENEKLKRCIKLQTCKICCFSETIQMADQRIQMYILHIKRLEKKNKLCMEALNQKNKNTRFSTGGSTKRKQVKFEVQEGDEETDINRPNDHVNQVSGTGPFQCRETDMLQ